jgi:hypothetical protein
LIGRVLCNQRRTLTPSIRGITLLSTYKDTLGFKVFDCTEQNGKVSHLIALLKDPEIQSFLKVFVDSAIATSELKILKRLSACESILGLDDYSIDGSTAPSIPERLSKLENKINNSTYSCEHILEPPIKPVTKTQKRACALVTKLRQCKKRFLTSSEIIDFLRHEAPDDIRITEDICNPREIKKEVIEKAAELFSDIQLSKKSHGRREVRILIS